MHLWDQDRHNHHILLRHDCQDGSDENDCLFENHDIDREFWCFSGDEEVFHHYFHHLHYNHILAFNILNHIQSFESWLRNHIYKECFSVDSIPEIN